MSATAAEPPPPGSPNQPDNPETMALIYAEARDIYAYFTGWADALTSKALGLFTTASLIVSLVPAVTDLHPIGWLRWLWLGALACWAVASVSCGSLLWPRGMVGITNPRVALDGRWTTLQPVWYYRYRVEHLAEVSDKNRQMLRAKTTWLLVALVAMGLEVLLLALLLLLRG
jgi:hypothetical protein